MYHQKEKDLWKNSCRKIASDNLNEKLLKEQLSQIEPRVATDRSSEVHCQGGENDRDDGVEGEPVDLEGSLLLVINVINWSTNVHVLISS